MVSNLRELNQKLHRLAPFFRIKMIKSDLSRTAPPHLQRGKLRWLGAQIPFDHLNSEERANFMLGRPQKRFIMELRALTYEEYKNTLRVLAM